MPLLAAALLSAVVATFLFIILLALPQIEEPWNIIVVSETVALMRITFVAALAHALVLGLPLFLLLRSISHAGIVSCAVAGFLVGAVPFAVLVLISMFGVQNASTGGEATVVNGVPTLAGWIELAHGAGFTGLFGLAGGLTFWLAMRVSGQIGGEPTGTEAQSIKLRAGSWSIVSTAVLLTCTVVLLPTVVRDNSCHNLFRDGRTSVGPQIDADINLAAEDWPMLRQIFIDFGVARSLSFRSDEHVQGGTVMWQRLSLCNEAGVNIDATDQPWLTQTNSFLAHRGINFTVYELRAGSGWNELTRPLLDKIDVTWPNRTTFRGPDGKVLSMQDALTGRH